MDQPGITKKVVIGGVDVYIHTHEDDCGGLAGLGITVSKMGDELRVYHVLADIISVAMNNGTPLSDIIDAIAYCSFEPCGVTSDPDIPIVSSIVDYLARWLGKKYSYETTLKKSDL